MRQNPMISSRVQVGGRPMPSWFSASLVNQSRATMSTPPPLPAEPPPTNDESEYEEIDHFLRNKNTGARRPAGGKRACNLCGNPNPVVSCEMCDNQIFCGSCNDMYHRHPKRLHHVRKILESLDTRPPLPPKTFLTSPPVNEMAAALPPVPPPRRNKRFGMRSATSSPTTTRKVFDPMGSLKRFVGGMGQRPLPPPPKPGPPLPPKSFELGRAMTPSLRGPISGVDRRHSSPQPPNFQMRPSEHRARNFPNSMAEPQNFRNQSVSVANLSNQHSSSRENGFNDWEEEEEYFARQRAHSISTPQGSRYPVSSQNVSHFATLQRPKQGSKVPERPPPPVPPRNFSSQSQLGYQSSQSAFNLNQMGMAPQFGMPWNYPGQGYPFDYQQQAAMMGYPGTMRRTPSNSSMGGGGPPQQFFGWGPMGFGPPMSQQEMEMEILAARRGSEPPVFANQRPHSVTQSQPVTPQGSFRKKTRPSVNQDRHAMAEATMNERFLQTQQIKQRPSTPSSFVRVKPSAQVRERNYHSPQNQNMPNLANEFDTSNLDLETTEEPEGPWTCEHCTFINPKSTKVCTICCKTPSDGYRCTGQAKSNYRRKESTGSMNDEIPVLKSKLSISRGEKQQATINLVERVERVSSPMNHRSAQPRGKQFSQPSPSKAGNNEYEEYEDQNEEEIDEKELERQAQRHHIRIDTKKPMKTVTAALKLTDSNEDVYGSVPVQALTISPKIEIRRPTKTVTTGVGSSPPKVLNEEANMGTFPPSIPQVQFNPISNLKNTKSDPESKLSPTTSSRSKYSDSSSNSAEDKSSRSKGSSSASMAIKDDKVSKDCLDGSSKSISPKQTVASVSSGIQSDITGESSNESGANNSSSGSRSSDSISPASLGKRSQNLQAEIKNSKGTSPPPQSISTQTYEDLPASSMRKHSTSKTSNTSMQSLQSDDFAPPKPVEMSEKAQRYARKAQHHHQAKLKRSLSTHLTSAAEPWVDTTADGRHLYRSSSRHSLMSDTRSLPLSGPPSRDASPPSRSGSRFYEDFKRFAAPSWDRFPTPEDYFASLEDLVSRKRRDSVRSQEFELTRLLKDAEEYNYTPEDVQVALRMCGERNPIKWLQENWSSMIETVQTLATKYGREKGHENNQIGTISSAEAKEALRTHKGNVWAAVTECVEQRRKKFLELQSRGTFLREDILTALTANYGNLDAAYVELSKAQLKPFLMRIWGPPAGTDNDAVPPTPSIKSMDMEPSLPKVQTTVVTNESVLPQTESKSAISSNNLQTDGSERKPDTSVGQLPEADNGREQGISLPIQQKIGEDATEIAESKHLGPEPRLEMLVSNATKVTQEIEKTLQELKLSKSKPIENIEEQDNTAMIASKLESEFELNPNLSVHSIRSDEGEDESFADAVSDSDINAASPNLEEQDQMEMDQDEDDYDEDILEIEIDDSEANISEFIQNYDIVPARSQPVEPPSDSNKKAEFSTSTQIEVLKENQIQEGNKPQESNPNIPSDNKPFSLDQSQSDALLSNFVSTMNPIESGETKNINRLSSTEIEQLLNTLTTTFTEMGQFATEIKAKIATEIQQQLSVAVNLVSANVESHQIVPGTSQGDQSFLADSNEPLYEPVLLPESIIDNVDKKLAKYKRLAAKKQQKSSRHKSPDSRVSGKAASSSPSPASSTGNVSSPITAPALDPETTEQVVSSNAESYTNAEIEIIETQDAVSDGNDYEDAEMVRDESEYSGSDSAESSEDFVDEVDVDEEEGEELVEEDLASVEESDVSSEEPDAQEVFEDEVYEEVEMSHSSDYDIYSNKDTEKLITNAANQKVPFTTSTAGTALTDTEDHVAEGATAYFELPESVKPKTELEIKVARLIEEGKTETVEKAGLAMQLMDMNFGEDDSIHAANECSSLYAALSFLQQECDLCAGKFSARQMVSMLRCTHVCCQSCAKEYFTVQIRDKTIIDATCPFCSEPSNLADEPELATDYFTHLEILLKSFVESRIHEMFQRKLRDWALAKTPNFKWCSKCSSGFITEPLQTRLICPDCNAVTCAICLETWDKFNHDHRESKVKVCDSASKSIVDYLNENSIECPRCHFRFALARGGCMHLTCTQCRHEFCSGCSAPFKMGVKCEAKLPVCDRLGLHAHHPRNCLFYLRDKEPETLCKLLEESVIPYLKENSGGTNQDLSANGTSKAPRECQVPIQKETPDGLKDDICGKDAPPGYATVCKAHYVEYLGLLIWQNHLDPISILSSDDLEVIIRRAYKKHPGRPYPTSDDQFRKRLLRVIQEEIPL